MTAPQPPAPAAHPAAGAGPLTAADLNLITRHTARTDRRRPWGLCGWLHGQFLDLYADRAGVTARIRDAHGTRSGVLAWRDLDRAAEPVQLDLWGAA